MLILTGHVCKRRQNAQITAVSTDFCLTCTNTLRTISYRITRSRANKARKDNVCVLTYNIYIQDLFKSTRTYKRWNMCTLAYAYTIYGQPELTPIGTALQRLRVQCVERQTCNGGIYSKTYVMQYFSNQLISKCDQNPDLTTKHLSPLNIFFILFEKSIIWL